MTLSVVNHIEVAREFQRIQIHEQNAANEDKTTLGKWSKGQEARLLTDSNDMLTLRPPKSHNSPAASELDPEDHRSEERRPNKEAKVNWVRKPPTIKPAKLNHTKSKKRPQKFPTADSKYRVKSPWQRFQKKPEPLKPVPQKTSEKTRALIRRDRSAAISEEKSMFCFGLPEPETHYPNIVPDKKSADAPKRNVRHEVAYTRNTRPISSSSNSSGTEPQRRGNFAELKEQYQRIRSRKRLTLSKNKEQSSSQMAENLQWPGDKGELVQRRRFSKHTLEDFGGTQGDVLGTFNSNNVNNRS